MINYQSKEKGFTLIELILVIFIIAVLSTLAINGYTQYRRSALLDFAADNFAAEFYALRDNTIHGNYGGTNFEEIKAAIESGPGYVPPLEEEGETITGEAKCYGLYFQNISDGVEVKKIEIPYSGLKKPTAINDLGDFSWNFETCDKDSLATGLDGFLPLEKDASVKFVEVYNDENDGASLSDFAILFVPPDGSIEIVDSSGSSMPLKKIKMVIKYGESDENQFKRNIFIDLKSGKISITRLADV